MTVTMTSADLDAAAAKLDAFAATLSDNERRAAEWLVARARQEADAEVAGHELISPTGCFPHDPVPPPPTPPDGGNGRL